MTTEKTKRIPRPVYAAAGAGDLAYQKLRTLPTKVSELRERVRPFIVEKETSVDVERLRAAARRNANLVITRAQAAGERAVTTAQAAGERAAVVYGDLVARGEQVVSTMRAENAADDEEPAAALAAPPAELTAAGTDAPEATTAEATTAEAATGEAKGAGKAGKTATAKASTRRTKPAAK